ncbi:MAG: 1-deoxy-D-xylulose-5-phosphate synthase [Flavobacteriales bacterium]|nr:1-deoxy-D-xylulose-5-phosphate synthase [Flavobacteriales bacterium]
MKTKTNILNKINEPKDLKPLSVAECVDVCAEIRALIIEQLSQTPGHFSASLGVVELTVAIHQIFDTPNDQLVWDVGHQAYAHKMLTGRKDAFASLRMYKGLSGFPKRSESHFDDFGTGHSSTSISAVLGMAIASKLDGQLDRQHIAVIGDGALTAGMAYEALNNAVETGANVLIIVNDNQQSIDENVGALEKHLKGIDEKGNVFTNLGISYFGQVDGNDYSAIHEALLAQKAHTGVRVLHCKTVKGKGYAPAEEGDPATWHAPGKFHPETGERFKGETTKAKKYQDVFGEELVKLGKLNKDIVAITPAMTSGSSLHFFKKQFPERFFDVGIAEQHAVTFAAGLAANGKVPFCVIYSTFLQRAYDQLIHDVAIQNLPVIFCVDRAGLVGEDGTTHHGVLDISFLRSVPNLVILSPRDQQELINALHWAVEHAQQPIVIRYPRGKGELEVLQEPQPLIKGKGEQLVKGKGVAVISVGKMAQEVSKAIAMLNEGAVYPSHYDARFIKPIDTLLLKHISENYQALVVVEDGVLAGGMGSAIIEYLSTINSKLMVKRLGISDVFVDHGSVSDLYQEVGIDAASIHQTIVELYS